MTHPPRRFMRKSALGATVLLMVAACAGAGEADDPSRLTEPGTVTTVSSNDAMTSSSEDSAPSDDGEETFADFFGVEVFDDPGAEEAAREEAILLREEAIRACMVGEGFEYMPVLPTVHVFTIAEGTEEERVRQWGFHITTEAGSGVPSVIDPAFLSAESADPNADRLAAMSDAERLAWNDALTECDVEIARTSPEEVMGYVLVQLFAELDDLLERVESDPRVVDLEFEWARCMGEAGYEFADREKLLTAGMFDLQTRFGELMGDQASFNPLAGWTVEESQEFFDGKSEEEIEAFFKEADQERLEAVDTQALAALQQEEIDLVVADLECRHELDYEETREEVRQEYEADFISSNRAKLDKLISDAQDR